VLNFVVVVVVVVVDVFVFVVGVVVVVVVAALKILGVSLFRFLPSSVTNLRHVTVNCKRSIANKPMLTGTHIGVFHSTYFYRILNSLW